LKAAKLIKSFCSNNFIEDNTMQLIKRLLLVLTLVFSTNILAAEYTAQVGFDLSQNDAYMKISNFLFWKNYTGRPTFLSITNERTGEVTDLEHVTEVSVALVKGCYKKIKEIVKSGDDVSRFVLYIGGKLKELKIKIDKKSKLKFKEITECVFEEL
jgi:hypothetical protein